VEGCLLYRIMRMMQVALELCTCEKFENSHGWNPAEVFCSHVLCCNDLLVLFVMTKLIARILFRGATTM
jgi:hypothetical protein